MKVQDEIIGRLAKKYGKDARTIREIVYSPLKFAKRIITDPSDTRPIRIRYFGVFVEKPTKTKQVLFEKKVVILLANIDDVTLIMGTTLGFMVPSSFSAAKIIQQASDDKDYEKIDMIYESWKLTSKRNEKAV